MTALFCVFACLTDFLWTYQKITCKVSCTTIHSFQYGQINQVCFSLFLEINPRTALSCAHVGSLISRHPTFAQLPRHPSGLSCIGSHFLKPFSPFFICWNASSNIFLRKNSEKVKDLRTRHVARTPLSHYTDNFG